jgi:hypothetical protein
MEWDTSYWYNFKNYNAKNDFSQKEGWIVTGSSVAMFSVIPEELESRLGEKSKVRFFSHVAMTPSDLYYYQDEIISQNPKKVLLIINPADMQMEYLRWKDEANYEFDTAQYTVDFSDRKPALYFYPWLYLRDHYKELPSKNNWRLFSSGFLLTNRYKSFLEDPLDKYIEHHFRKGKSFHNYTGAIPTEGIWQKGWTKPQTKMVCTPKSSNWQDSLFSQKENVTVTLHFHNRTESIFFHKSGWKNFGYSLPSNEPFELVIETKPSYSSSEVDSRVFGKEYSLGVRLTQNFCSNLIPKDIAYSRPKGIDEDRFHEMTMEDYKEDYYIRLYKNKEERLELWRLNRLEDAKVRLKNAQYSQFPELEILKPISKKFKESNIEFFIINSPENPIELVKYYPSQWYREFESQIMQIVGTKYYLNFNNKIDDPRHFTDPHHLTRSGAFIFTKSLADKIIDLEL